MCGRFVSTNSAEEIAAYFGAVVDEPAGAAAPVASEPNYNVAPTTAVLGVVETPARGRVVRSYRWGLVPSWAKDLKVGAKMINARCETITEKSVFKQLLERKRLIVPMAGFYEWRKLPGEQAKQPMFVHRVDGQPLAVAGLWTSWRDPGVDDDDAAWLQSCAVVTTSANATMAPIHDRMPVVLPDDAWARWLDPDERDLASLQRLLVPAPDDLLTMHPVSTAVNNVRNNGEELLVPVG